MAVYRAHMAGGGVLAFNVSNRFVDLEPVVLGLAADARLPAVSIADVGGGPGLDASDWVLVSDSRALLERDEVMFAESTRPRPRGVLWTDEHGSLVGLLRLTEAP